MLIDISSHAPRPANDPAGSSLADGLAASEILRIAGEVRRLRAQGRRIVDLTIGDFDPRTFPIPGFLERAITSALRARNTSYPPPEGIPALRAAIARYLERGVRLPAAPGSVVVAAGARPLLYAAFRAVLEPGDRVVFPVPSWNNRAFTFLAGAQPVPVATTAARGFFPTADELRAPLREARLLVITSPLNPAGTSLSARRMLEIARLVVHENLQRQRAGRPPLWLLHDQVYWPLHDEPTVSPAALLPEVAPHTIVVDAASKAFAATGLRLGWAVLPPALHGTITALLGHMGAWAPTAEQVALARFLDAPAQVADFRRRMNAALGRRTAILVNGLEALRAEGLPVQVLPGRGGLYVAARLRRVGHSDEEVRRYLLEHGVAVVPFTAFDAPASGWFRLSAGAASPGELREVVGRLRQALAQGRPVPTTVVQRGRRATAQRS